MPSRHGSCAGYLSISMLCRQIHNRVRILQVQYKENHKYGKKVKYRQVQYGPVSRQCTTIHSGIQAEAYRTLFSRFFTGLSLSQQKVKLTCFAPETKQFEDQQRTESIHTFLQMPSQLRNYAKLKINKITKNLFSLLFRNIETHSNSLAWKCF